MDADVIIHGANITVLIGFMWGGLKFIVPTAISIRDGLRDTAASLKTLTDQAKDHEARLREIERYTGPERRAPRQARMGE